MRGRRDNPVGPAPGRAAGCVCRRSRCRVGIGYSRWVRLVIAKCSVDYAGRLSAHLPLATRLLMLKSDGSVLIHSDGGSYKPLNWMSPPCTLTVAEPEP